MIRAEWTNDDALTTGQATKANDSNTLNALECVMDASPEGHKGEIRKDQEKRGKERCHTLTGKH